MESDDNAPATKGDLKRLETDLQRLETATQADSKRLEANLQRLETATQADSKRLEADFKRLEDSTKMEFDQLHAADHKLNDKMDRLAVEVVRIQEDVREIKNNMATKADISRVFEYADTMIRKGEFYDQKAGTHGKMFIDMEDKIRDHEHRISRLETG